MSGETTKLLSIAMQMGLHCETLEKQQVDSGFGRPIPVLVIGPPGVAKTEVINHIARSIAEATKKPFPCETYSAAQLCAEDLSGLPVPDLATGTTRLLPLHVGKEVLETQRGVVFLDELTSSSPSVGAACLTFIQSGILGETKISNAVARVAAANPSDMAASGRDLSAPESNRFLHLTWELSHRDFFDWMLGGVGAAKDVVILEPDWEQKFGMMSRSVVVSYLKKNPSAILEVPPPNKAGGAWPSNRSWTNASRLIAAIRSAGYSLKSEMVRQAVVGCVGETHGNAFVAWLSQMNLPDPEDILKDPLGIKIDETRSDVLACTFDALTTEVLTNKNHPNLIERMIASFGFLMRFKDKEDVVTQPTTALGKFLREAKAADETMSHKWDFYKIVGNAFFHNDDLKTIMDSLVSIGRADENTLKQTKKLEEASREEQNNRRIRAGIKFVCVLANEKNVIVKLESDFNELKKLAEKEGVKGMRCFEESKYHQVVSILGEGKSKRNNKTLDEVMSLR